MSNFITLIKSNLIKQMRRYPFFLIIGASIFLGFLSVPGKSAGYEIFYIGGVRGIYNSAWLGVLAAQLPVLQLWLPGFYLLRSQITDDSDLKIGQMIAASPVSMERYIYGKFAANFSVLMVLQLIFLAAVMGMQLFHRESIHLAIMDYFEPLVFVTIPYLLFLAAMTVLFDVVPFLKGTVGNIIAFSLWIALTTISVILPGGSFDLFGMGVMLNSMLNSARVFFPGIGNTTSFGYYPTSGETETFVWEGMEWSRGFLTSRLVWLIASFVLVQVAVLTFNRFKETSRAKRGMAPQADETASVSKRRQQTIPQLSGVVKSGGVNLPLMLWGELKILLRGHSMWWYLSALAVIALTPVLPAESIKWISLGMLLPTSIWSQMGNREKACGASQFIASSCPAPAKWICCWLAGVIVSILISLGMFARIVMLGEWGNFVPWLCGILFIPTLALVLGGFSGNRRLFEAVFIALLYLGPINELQSLDFLGFSGGNVAFFAAATVILFGIGLSAQILKEKRIIFYH